MRMEREITAGDDLATLAAKLISDVISRFRPRNKSQTGSRDFEHNKSPSRSRDSGHEDDLEIRPLISRQRTLRYEEKNAGGLRRYSFRRDLYRGGEDELHHDLSRDSKDEAPSRSLPCNLTASARTKLHCDPSREGKNLSATLEGQWWAADER
ncbi:uncharacterized protein LOC21390622 [Morus notabilis]|uniref:uncharacterized protein LOC21390622 n=1 Tax=Morus notabilis TaxID=981085 RepID=UPI000CED557A|nr:uncharacterized protein LOC21390622 [Morus notabilis]